MSVEEEVELRDLVAQTLESNGCLPKIRAQLRANLFLALEEDSKISKQQPLLNNKIKSNLEAPEGQLMFCLVREFLEYFNLDFTISVYEPESYLGNFYKYEGRQKIIDDLGLNTEVNFSGPVLLHLIKIAQAKSRTLKINLTNINGGKNDELKSSSNSASLSSGNNEINGHNLSDVDKNCKNKEQGYHSTNSSLKNLKANIQVKDNVGVAPVLNSTFTKKEAENDDTFNGTSSIEEDNGTDYSVDVHQRSTVDEERLSSTSRNINGTNKSADLHHRSEESVSPTSEDTSPESKSKSDDKIKTLSQKSDKIKSKLELSPLNKSRGSDILPSLYSKDFKEKCNKDFDTDFDIKDNYQEEDYRDFMSGSEVAYSESKEDSPQNESANNKNSQSKISSITKNLASQKIKTSSSDNNKISNETNSIETNLSVDSEVNNFSRSKVK